MSSNSGESDSRAEGGESLTDDKGCINLAEGHALLLENAGPVGVENRVNLPTHVVVVLVSEDINMA